MARRIPFVFEGCAATLHQAEGGRGVLIVSPTGFEDLCAHRSLDRLAQMTADAGMPTLRFDLPGSGDSLGDGHDPGLLDRWRVATSVAVDELKRLSGVTEVALVGLRLGAFLVADVAADRADITQVALLAPPEHGRNYLRELKLLARVIDAKAGTTEASAQVGLDLAGFQLHTDNVVDMRRLDWRAEPPAGETLVLNGAGGVSERVLQTWTAGGAKVTRREFVGYDKMMCDPTATVAPTDALRAVVEFLRGNAPGAKRVDVEPPMTMLAGAAWLEEHIVFGDDTKLAGVVCRPAGRANDEGIVLANAGGIRRVGWGRQNVEFARFLALQGVTTLRFDFSGIAGPRGPEIDLSHLYGREPEHELTAAVDILRRRGLTSITLVGACSGAFQCFRAALADSRVTRVVLVNQVYFEWRPQFATPLNAWMASKSGSIALARRAEDETRSRWGRLSAHLQSVAFNAAKPLAKKAFRLASAMMERSANASERAGASPAGDLARLIARGTSVDFIYSEGDPGLAQFDKAFGKGGERALASPFVSLTLLPDADHLLSSRSARKSLLAILGRGSAQPPPQGKTLRSVA